MMKIYTRTGDEGETSLVGGKRVSKDHDRIEAYGTLDEANSLLGLVLAQKPPSPLLERFQQIQGEILQLGSELATPENEVPAGRLLDSSQIERLELEIDEMNATLPELTHFILPGGCELSALIHLLRTVIRRSERLIVSLHLQSAQRKEVLQYVNRLGDYMFVSARYINVISGIKEAPWPPRKS